MTAPERPGGLSEAEQAALADIARIVNPSPERPEHAWLGGKCFAMLDALPDDTIVTSEYPSEGEFTAGEARVGLESMTEERPAYVMFEVVRWPDGEVPSAGVSGGGGPCGDHDELVERLRDEAEFYTDPAWAEDPVDAGVASSTARVLTDAADALAGCGGGSSVEELAAGPEVARLRQAMGALDRAVADPAITSYTDWLNMVKGGGRAVLAAVDDALAGCGGHGPQPDTKWVPLDETDAKFALRNACAETDDRSGYPSDAEVLVWVLAEAGYTLCRRPSGGV